MSTHDETSSGPVNCNVRLRFLKAVMPRTCERCGLGPCPFFRNDGSSKLNEQARPTDHISKTHPDVWERATTAWHQTVDTVGAPECIAIIAHAILAERERLAGEIAYALTKRLVIDMPTARSAVDDAMRGIGNTRPAPDDELVEALRPFLPAYQAYVETMQNFIVSGETSAERRFSEGECADEAMENAYQELAKVTFENLHAVHAALAHRGGDNA